MSDTAAALPGTALRYGTGAGRWVILATVLGSGITALDSTVVGIGLPAIGKEFHIGVDGLQWTVNAYTVTLAGLLLLGGSLGDRFGRRRVFLIGVVWFAVASLLCGIAPNAPMLVIARALQGVGGALLMPGSLAILEASFADGDRARAIGAWSGLGGVATAIGPFVGGYLINAVSWRLIFYINLPLAAAVIVIALRHVPESRDPRAAKSSDVTGAALAALGLAGVTYGLTEGPTHGWNSAAVLGSLFAGVLALALFLLVEARGRAPMMPLGVFRSRQFSAANAVTFIVYAALGGALFLVPVVLQSGAGYSPLQAGVSLLPITAIMLAFSARSAALSARIGPRLQMSVGPIVVAGGMALFTLVGTGGDYFTEVLPPVLLLAAGLAITVAPLTATALSAAPPEHAGVASAVNNTVARSGTLIAVAVLPAAAAITGTSYLHPAELVAGFHTAVLVAAVACAAGGVLAALTIRNRPAADRRPAATHHHSCPLDGPPQHADRGSVVVDELLRRPLADRDG
jgi:EmrB/QacA subfamily drug resistance transporter